MARQNLGRVAMLSKGEYSSIVTYENLDIVTYNGSSYVCIQDSTGNLPTDTEYFDILAEKGADGEDGQQGAPATINGVNALTINANNGISLSQVGSTATISGSSLEDSISSVNSNIGVLSNLTTTEKSNLVGAINEVDSIALGANQAVSYASISTMVTAFNALDDDVYRVGQNIYIVTTDVPDLWVSSIESTSSTYTYTTDSAFTSALATNGYVQVGYYKLSALETQKVDLTNYYNKTETNTLLTAKTGSSAPTTSTTADYVGQIYLDTTNNKTYQCIDITGSTYTWVELVRADQLTNYTPKSAFSYDSVTDTLTITIA